MPRLNNPASVAAGFATNADMQTVLSRLGSIGFSAVSYYAISLAAGAGSGTATIASVDTTKSCIIPLGVMGNADTDVITSYTLWQQVHGFDLALTNATTVTLTRVGNANDAITVGFAVVYFAGANSVQTGTIVVNGVASASTVITSVNATKSLALSLGMTVTTAVNSARDLCRVSLTDATHVTATRGPATGSTTWRFVVVEMA